MKKEIRQNDPLSTVLFNLVLEETIKDKVVDGLSQFVIFYILQNKTKTTQN